jgi:hypothetical protein
MPRKTFTAGEVLAAADVNLYLSNEITLTSSTATSLTVETADRYKTLVMAGTAASTVSFSLERLDFAIFIIDDAILGELDNDRLAYE